MQKYSVYLLFFGLALPLAHGQSIPQQQQQIAGNENLTAQMNKDAEADEKWLAQHLGKCLNGEIWISYTMVANDPKLLEKLGSQYTLKYKTSAVRMRLGMSNPVSCYFCTQKQ